MNDTLTYEILDAIASRLKAYEPVADVILLTNLQASRLRKACGEGLKTSYFDELGYYNRSFAGIPYESFLTTWEVKERALELIRKGKKVIVIKNES